ncbi:metalloregulator ArsR/SmtB family transcription factor [Brevifollis gellanilyticus]|uniref:Transcriptional regulator n=1 Tax=Brevifollis gellanilyticus TaxID=748831 RepID=A0A512MGW1_9BACT|nr:metalloregulator ArsR/SmtB family transcription factor [Brevifollis gellanilyticus]GEP45959.1 transcriptional regulator [Brevifollis gellanilyticus]
MESLEAIADPTRRRIVEMLARKDRTVGEIVGKFDMSAPAISQHLKVLREAGLVSSRVEGQSRIQTLNPAGLQQIQAWLVSTMNYWNRRLDALEAALRADDEKNKPRKKGRQP